VFEWTGRKAIPKGRLVNVKPSLIPSLMVGRVVGGDLVIKESLLLLQQGHVHVCSSIKSRHQCSVLLLGAASEAVSSCEPQASNDCQWK